MRLYGNIQKVDAEQRTVSGYASTEAVDAQGEIVLKSAIEAALGEYLDFGNIREMHALSAVGVAEEATVDDKGLYISAKIVDDAAWAKVTSGVYKGFSIGGRTLARDPDNKKIITKIVMTEISLVDRPSNPEARFDVWKATGADPLGRINDALANAQRTLAPDPGEIIMKALAAKDVEIDRLNKRIEQLLEEPAPPKTAGSYGLVAVSKEQDIAGNASVQKATPNEGELVSALAAMHPDDRAMLLIKAAHQLPRPAVMGRSHE
jgi:phage head maturation protease